MSPSSVSAVILAGGRSRRFGRDKAGYRLEGRTLLSRVAEIARPLVREILVVARTGQDLPECAADRMVFDDEEAPEGPLRGIVAGLRAAREERTLVLACDAPEVDPAFLRFLLDALKTGDLASAGTWEGRLQPFPSVYRAAAAEPLAGLLAEGLRSPRAALLRIPCAVLDEAACREADPDGASFGSLNTPVDGRGS